MLPQSQESDFSATGSPLSLALASLATKVLLIARAVVLEHCVVAISLDSESLRSKNMYDICLCVVVC